MNTQQSPLWSQELRQRYLRSEASQFILYGNVHDLVLYENQTIYVEDYLARHFLAASKDTVALYDTSSGVRFTKRAENFDSLQELMLERRRQKLLPALERILSTQSRFALILSYAEMLAPAGDIALYGETDRESLVTLLRWSAMPSLEHSDNIVIMMVENLSDLHPRLINNARIASICIPLPAEPQRKEFIAHLVPELDMPKLDRLTAITAGLKAVQIRGILQPQIQGHKSGIEIDAENRKKWIANLLHDSPNSERVIGLTKITQGMSEEEIRKLIAPERQSSTPDTEFTFVHKIESMFARQKRDIIERECAGLLQFVESNHGFEAVGGMSEVKEELGRVAKAIRAGNVAHVPMGFLFVGPMGTGKTFVAEAFAKESGLACVKFGSFRSKWVGATESNLERILNVLSGMGQVIVVIDEVDRALAGTQGNSDGGTESRVIARLKEFMSDTDNRGRILFVLMTNRPDMLDTDIKRSGRLDRKIPFFYAQTGADLIPILQALVRRHDLSLTPDTEDSTTKPEDPWMHIAMQLVGYSNADIEGVVLLTASLADRNDRSGQPRLADFDQAIIDYLPTKDIAMIEFMELLAVFEASNRSMLPKKYRNMSSEDLAEHLSRARIRVGNRR